MTGCIGVTFAFTGDLKTASFAIFVSLVFDYLDGFAARLLNARSAIGKELDSLADLISFGLVPSVICYQLLQPSGENFLTYIPFLITVFSAYRLAKFNTDSRQTKNFIGLPTPANAIFWSSFPLILFSDHQEGWQYFLAEIMGDPIFISACIVVTSYLLIAELRLFSLKFENIKIRPNLHRYLLLFLAAIMIVILGFYAIPFIIILYLVISIIQSITSKANEIQGGN